MTINKSCRNTVLYVTLTISSFLSFSELYAGDPSTTPIKACHEALNACDLAIDAGNKALELRGKVIKLQAEQVKALREQIVAVESERDSFFRNPYVLFLFGLAAGGISVGILTK